MKIKENAPNWTKECAINDCKTVEEFAYKYRKPDRFTGQGEDYVNAVLKTHHEELKNLGYTSISKHDNVTGKLITYLKE